ncbi:Fur family transcriptional regulator [Gloeobacter kilaueensis]|uniref:Ferric uptake regulation protein n=1 Tax=Gloeobacter kilaueensis (strain ATCC BAA-2537 / CCAP 1431/1 / ULC 316 / JS1) TaxID=1183438 RepID=U5QDH1_GLOK1|nr:transcriptional repressor [Gloeobacter kilaueensis]AGY56977.1 ferric uptake regulation protein [Gloeobacter kilaueensis JS1]
MSVRKLTKGQQAVLEVLVHSHRPLSAQDIYLELRGTEQEVGLATVYRSLEALHGGGRVQIIDVRDNQAHYLIGKASHSQHHLICLNCKRVVPLDHCPVGDLEKHLSQDHEFQIEYHVLDFYGTCGDCRQVVGV